MEAFVVGNRRIGLLSALAIGWMAAASHSVPGGSEPVAIAEPADAQRSIPKVTLAPLSANEDDHDFLRTIAARAEELGKSASSADDPIVRCELALSAANLILAHQLEPMGSLMLLGAEVDPHLQAEIREALERSKVLLDLAEESFGKFPSDPGDAAAKIKKITYQLEALRGFFEALRAYLLPQADAEGMRQSRKAASRLSVLLEDENPSISVPAALWYASLRGRETDPEAAISVLDSVLSDPPRSVLAQGFFARLLRCQLLAQQGGHAAALALLLQVEERCDQWFSDATRRDEAIRAATLVQMHVLNAWRERLNGSAQSAERQWCVDRITALSKERFGSGEGTVLRLGLAIPLMNGATQNSRPSQPDRNEGR